MNLQIEIEIVQILCIYLLLQQQCFIVDGYRILAVFPHPAKTHFQFFRPILHGLADSGHDVTVFSYFPESNINVTNYRDISLQAPDDLIPKDLDLNSDWLHYRPYLGSYLDFMLVYGMGKKSCNKAFQNNEIKKLISSENQMKFDLILLEYFATDCLAGLAWKLQIPIVGLSSSHLAPWHYRVIGNPHFPAFESTILTHTSMQMTFFERMSNFLNVYILNFLYETFVHSYTNAMLKEHIGDNVPPVQELVKNTSLILVNTHYSLNGANPVSPALIEIGGIHLHNSNSTLDQETKELLDDAVDGVIFISWGSILRTDTMSPEKRNNLLRVLGKLKQKVLMKWETELPNKPNNIITRKWFAQKDILCHPNVLVFFTHGGMNGILEGVNCGKAMICTPMFGDQHSNCAAVEKRGIGILLPYSSITVETVQNALNTALNPSTQANAKDISLAFQTRIHTPLETALWWIEYVARTKGATVSVKSEAQRNMSVFVYYSYDIVIVLFALFLIASYIFILKIRKWCFVKFAKTKID